ncbi:diguanylate cyclase/phosphodiesterase (GGDEF & EAL domains) with PAS/PAC sensor(s) [Paramagnetospirillum magnetotacticum MS-1]|uniref:Diguanylate cyclase/phosphodiesterase (GGDEF & EAL domains) with PAS/PAC sensor(S) n=1 Tax=Paramagnetospirillum magnetotacticum MS-1 TaxID=272627 RepID=A0A0C2YXK8_PARME|nr:EAL domain-containing protein [Paramagnetospirillum magnetotacticum]KIL99848.1 diguanylate cyclase/phosphodiesterase (GGDEF & EAL domains) with PAS/PAC sensor(s) [Paramagnetospirillum magnetotacticum MS-1]
MVEGKGQSSQRRIEELSQQVERLSLYQAVFDNAFEGMFATDCDNRIIAVNPAFTAITGYTAEEAVGNDPHMLSSGFHDRAFYEEMWAKLSSTGLWQGEVIDRHKDGRPVRLWLSISSQRDAEGKTARRIAVFRDVTEARETAEQLWQRSNFDPLTELPNRNLFLDRLLQALVLAGREGSKAAMLFIGLDGFKNINDSLGHWIGDKVLQEASRRFQNCLRQGDTAARFGGDEFTVVLSGIRATAEVEAVIRSVLEVLQEPFTVEHHHILISCSIGVCLWPGDGEDVEALMRNATAALQQAKQAGRNTFRFFTPAMDARAQARSRLADELSSALAQGEFHLVFQPLVDVKTGKVNAAEALLRWHNRYLGVVSPDQFVPLAEEIGLIRPIGEWLLTAACREALVWQGMGLGEINIAVNISPRQFQQGDIVGIIRRALEETRLPPWLLTIEITEGLLLSNGEEILAKMETIRALGVSLSVDDFGTGYSSLSYLKSFPVDVLKIDRSFIADMGEHSDDATMVEAIIALGHSLHLEVVAEGVETQHQMDFITNLGCDVAQGYFFSPPLSAARFREFVLERQGISEPEGSVAVAPHGVRVLFADDVELARLVFRDFLEGTGCLIDEAADGAEAIAKACAVRKDGGNRHQLMVLDLCMPGTDGFEAARAIRRFEADNGLDPVPLIALTVDNSEDSRDRARQAGFDRFLTKPIARSDLLAAMAEMLPPANTDSAPADAGLVAGINIPTGLEHLLPAFMAEMLKDQQTLRSLAEGRDRAALADHAHAMRGKCGMFGEEVLYSLLGDLESLAPQGDSGEITRLVAKVVERVGRL